MVSKTVFLGTNDEISITVHTKHWNETEQKYDLIPIAFETNGATEIKVYFGGVIVSSVDDPSMVRFDDDGNIYLSLGLVDNVTVGRSYPVKIIVLDPDHVNGQTVVDESRLESSLSITFKK